MHRRGNAILGGVPNVDHRNQLVAVRNAGSKGSNPKHRQVLVLCSQHQISGDDGGIDLTAVLPVVAADPSLIQPAPNGEKKRGPQLDRVVSLVVSNVPGAVMAHAWTGCGEKNRTVSLDWMQVDVHRGLVLMTFRVEPRSR